MTFFRFIPAFLLTSIYFTTGNAQKWYVKADAGYNFNPLSGALTSNYKATYRYTPNYQTNKYDISAVIAGDDVYGTLGTGFNYGISGGLFLNKKTLLELNISYLSSPQYEAITGINRTIVNNGIGLQQTITKQYTGKLLSFTPTVIFQQEESKKFRRYFKLGLILGNGWYTADINNYIDDGGTSRDTVRNKHYMVSGGLAVGGLAGIGLVTHLDKYTLFFMEVNMIYLDPDIGKAELKKYTLNNVDYTSKASEPDKNMDGEMIIYTEPGEKKKVDITRLESTSFSSLGISVGIIYQFKTHESNKPSR